MEKVLFQHLISDELRALNEFEEMRQRKEEIKEEVCHMSTRQLRRELLKYKYYELEKITHDTDSIEAQRKHIETLESQIESLSNYIEKHVEGGLE